MSIATIKKTFRDATQKPVIVRFVQSVVTQLDEYEPRAAYELPAGVAREFIAAKFCRELTEAGELEFARHEIAARTLL